MTNKEYEDFVIYLNKFEQRVIARGVIACRWGQDAVVPIQLSREEREARKEHTLEYVTLFGTRWVCDSSAVIDYYGLLKRSTGFMRRAVLIFEHGMRRMTTKLVRFTDIRLEDVEHFASDLAASFEDWKARVLDMKSEVTDHADAMASRKDQS